MPESPLYYGKYRAIVTDNKDPDVRGRIQVQVPAVPGLVDTWAIPCTPYAGKDVGFHFIPPIGALVWIEFEGGNINQPIWVGCFWDVDETPTEVAALNKDDPAQIKVLKTRVFTLWINDTDQKGMVAYKYVDPTLSEPVTVQFTHDEKGLNITVSSSKATSTIDQTPPDIITNSETLQTNTTKDTTMKADGNISETAKKDITLTATGKLTGKATDDASIEGKNVNGKANVNLTLTANTNASMKGNVKASVEGAQAEVKGSAMVTIQGGMVKIN